MRYLGKVTPFEKCESLAKKVVRNLNQNQLEHLSGEILGQIFWYKKKASFNTATRLQIAFLNRLGRYIVKCLNRPNCPIEVNENGIRIDRASTSLRTYEYERLLFKFSGWKRMLSLDFCRSYWINERMLEIVCYVEGDLITRTASNIEQLHFERDEIIRWHKDND